MRQTEPVTSKVRFATNDVSINSTSICQLDVTGTPLEDNCDITVISDWSVIKKYAEVHPWTDDEEQCAAIAEDLATKIVNDINVGVGSKCKNASMFALCDGSNGDHQFLLYTEYDKDWSWRGVGKFTVLLLPLRTFRLSRNSVSFWQGLIPFKEINLTALMKKHLSMMMNCNEASTKIESFYNIKSNQTIKCAWETASLTPTLKCNKNANVVLSQSIPIGDFDSCIEEYWRQLEILEGIKHDIERYKMTQSHADLAYKRCVK